MRRALTMSQGSYTIFIESPIAATFLAISLAMLLWPLVKMIRKPKSTT
jgi:TctA family transporter